VELDRRGLRRPSRGDDQCRRGKSCRRRLPACRASMDAMLIVSDDVDTEMLRSCFKRTSVSAATSNLVRVRLRIAIDSGSKPMRYLQNL
jgi:hypothetical protein